jgi:hypothetical protein
VGLCGARPLGNPGHHAENLTDLESGLEASSGNQPLCVSDQSSGLGIQRERIASIQHILGREQPQAGQQAFQTLAAPMQFPSR